jgi:hypothetical protein
MGVDQGGLVLPGEWNLAREALVQDTSQRVHIGPGVQRFPFELFGCRVVQRADELAGSSDPRIRGRSLGQAEV